MPIVSKESKKMERRKVIKKNEPKYNEKIGITTVAVNLEGDKSDPKLPLTIYFFNKPHLYEAFRSIAEEKEIPMRKLVLSFASLGLKAYLKQTGLAFKDDVATHPILFWE
jgi:hypothetical protein